MKHLGKLAVLGAVLAASAPFASADTILLASFGAAGLSGYQPAPGAGVTNSAMQYIGSEQFGSLPLPAPTTNGSGLLCCGSGPTAFSTTGAGEAVDLDPSGVWSAPLGPASIPDGGPASSWVGINANAGPAGTINPAYGYYEFQTTFTVTNGGSYSGDFDVMADDTTEVILDNAVLIPFGALDFDSHCSDTPPSCLAEDNDTNPIFLSAGSHTLTFIVEQAGTGPAGGNGDPSGVDFDATLTGPNVTPEPNSLVLLGTGLLGAAGMLMRKRRTV
jgi:hypothetical protein